MVFSSTLFIFLFLPAVLLVYYISPVKFRNMVLLIFSLLFYSWGEPVYILIMLFSTVFDYVNGLLIQRFHQKRKILSKLVLLLSVTVNLGILCFFKYGDFLVQNLNALLHTSFRCSGLPLPIGISFYTFQTMSYTIDVYRGTVRAQSNLIDFSAYVTMFPQLIAGPIVQYKDVASQLKSREVTVSGFSYGIRRFITGLCKKILLANHIGLLWEQISGAGPGSLPVLEAWLGAAAFSFQIYFDFSGYSDMAIGLGALFGFRFRENFSHPYCSKSITEFWRRWHISLGAWFREYVYIPLGGSRKGRRRLIFNLLAVWGLTGLWHGASWNFILWGLYFGILLILEKCFLSGVLERLPAVFRHLYTLFFVLISWMIFAFEDLGQASRYVSSMFGLNHTGILRADTLYYVRTEAFWLILCAVLSAGFCRRLSERWQAKSPAISAAAETALLSVLFLVSLCFLVGESYNPFLYFRF